MNYVSIIGNLTRDPELKFLPNGTAVCELGIAYNEVWYNAQKEKQERTFFFGAVAWAGMAENIAKYFAKGAKIAIEGTLTQESWEDKETGKKREKTKIRVTGFDFCGDSKKRADGNAAPPEKHDADLDAGDEDSIPF